MASLCRLTFQGLRLVALLALLACSDRSTANAGLISYTAGTGGTFNPSTPSTFTFTNFGQGTLSPGVDYTDVKVFARWNGTNPYPGAFNITSLSLSNPGTASAMGNISFLGNTAAGASRSNLYVPLSNAVVNTTSVGAVSLTLTIPTLTVNDGFYLQFALGFTDNDVNSNATAFQTVTAVNSPVPEIDPATGGSALSLVAGVLAMVEQRRRKRAAAAVVATA